MFNYFLDFDKNWNSSEILKVDTLNGKIKQLEFCFPILVILKKMTDNQIRLENGTRQNPIKRDFASAISVTETNICGYRTSAKIHVRNEWHWRRFYPIVWMTLKKCLAIEHFYKIN